MLQPVEIKVGDTIKMKKPHPCGSYDWKVLRVGMDFRLQCLGCGHMIMLSRQDVQKRMKKLVPDTSNTENLVK